MFLKGNNTTRDWHVKNLEIKKRWELENKDKFLSAL